jgi:uncharacterized protein (DUF58 family)
MAQTHKLGYALRLGAALGAVALGAGDRLTAAVLYAEGRLPQFGPSRGSQQLLRLAAFLENTAPAGVTDLNASLRDYALASRRPGLLFLISDLFAPTGFQEGLARLQARGYEVTVLQTLSPDELDPPLAGDLRLVDIETGHAQEVSLDSGLRDLYRRRIQTWQAEIQAYCLKRGIRYMRLSTTTPWDKVLLTEMRKAGVVR